jgi:acyl-CoA synthetase (NDP forming)
VRDEELVRALLAPRSVAIVGASADADSHAGRPLRALLDNKYAGTVTLVNPNRTDIAGIACLPSAAAIPPGSVEVALVAVSARHVAGVVRDLDAAGVRAVIILAKGFEAADSPHRAALREAMRSASVRLIGPNSLGLVGTHAGAYLTFSSVATASPVRPGGIALVSQSGAMGNVMLTSLMHRGAGVSALISTGDEFDAGAMEVTAGLLRHPDVTAVGMFLEGIVDLAQLATVADAIRDTGKPVYLVKAARTGAGASAAAGHTGRVIGASDATLAVLRAAGVVVVPSLSALTDTLVALDVLRPLRGNRVAVVSVSGGAGVLAADEIQQSGNLRLADGIADAATVRALSTEGPVGHPVDVGGVPTERFVDWVRALAGSGAANAVLVLQSGLLHDEETFVRDLTAQALAVPAIVVPVPEEVALRTDNVLRLAASGCAVIPAIDRAVAALDRLPGTTADRAEGTTLTEPGTCGFDAAVDRIDPLLPWAPFAVTADLAAAQAYARRVGFPVVVKAAGDTLAHRSDAGAVVTGVTPAHIADAFRAVHAVATAAGDRVIVQRQVDRGLELMISVVADPEIGGVAYVQLGGVLAELATERAILWSGWPPHERRRHLDESVAGQVLGGYRGGERYDIDAVDALIARLLTRIGIGDLHFIELNPVIVHHQGIALVDALAR